MAARNPSMDAMAYPRRKLSVGVIGVPLLVVCVLGRCRGVWLGFGLGGVFVLCGLVFFGCVGV